jgi:hypothetical protein
MKKFETVVTHDIEVINQRLNYLANEYLFVRVESIVTDHLGRFNAILSYVTKAGGFNQLPMTELD